MANEYTSIATQPGLATELTQDLWDKAVRAALRELPTTRQFVDVRPQDPMARGNSITIEKFEWFDGDVVAATLTPLDEEQDVDSVKMPKPTPVTLTPTEHGFAVTRTRLLNNKTFAPIDPQIALSVAQVQNEAVDALVQEAVVSGTTGISPGGVAESAITNASALTSGMLRRAVTRLRTNKAPTRDGSFYVGQAHPHVILDLREESGAGGWRVPNEYGASQERIWRGEVGEYEGVRWVENALTRVTKTGASGASVYQTYIFGRGGLAEAVYEEPHVVIGPEVDKLRRFRTVGWYGILDFAVFEPKAIQRIFSGADLGDDIGS